MKGRGLFTILLSCLLVLGVYAQSSSREEQRFQRQSDGFNFPGPRRQTPATLPVFGSDGGPRPRPGGRPFRPPLIESNEGGLDDGSFQEPDLPPPRRPAFRPHDELRGSGGDGGPRFGGSRPQFSQQDLGSDSGPLKQKGSEQDIVEEDKKPEPDRLTLLLQDSKFQCSEKKPGYYADDGLSCEVFHYCNEGVRHSWMCPAGTSFHQIHLICMAEGGDNICKQSSKYHFVNDYLYKPIADSSRDNNGTIRYANRYFPDEAAVDQGVNEQQGGGGGGGGFQGDDLGGGGGGGGGGFRPSSSSSFRPSRPPPSQQSEEEFFSPPPPRSHSGGGGGGPRFRPNIDDGQFGGGPPQHSPFASGSRSHPAAHNSGSTEDLSAFAGSDEDIGSRFQPPPSRGGRGGSSVERRPSGGRQFPTFVRH